ncbi:hypothetical protein [Micromonospora radicis]|uniref:hypothetical protein n=1 Tax=Micromonospora radicis TaxID=1894971 RepID=UPI0013148EC9|nr:hypothetical protein [Micromonospora radicis]
MTDRVIRVCAGASDAPVVACRPAPRSGGEGLPAGGRGAPVAVRAARWDGVWA